MLNANEADTADRNLRSTPYGTPGSVERLRREENLLTIYAEFRAFLAHEYASELPLTFEPILWDKVRRDDGKGLDYGRGLECENPQRSYACLVYDKLEIAYAELAGFVLEAVNAVKLETGITSD